MGVNSSNKQRFLKLMEPFRLSDVTAFTGDCKICKLFKNDRILRCFPCPFANKKGIDGCYEFIRIKKIVIDERTFNQMKKEGLKILRNIPAKRFTKKGWKYFKEIEHLRFNKEETDG